MKKRFGKSFILIPFGLFFLSGTLVISQYEIIPDILKGLLFGIGLGLIVLPFVLRVVKPEIKGN